jgi:hypothetical protein
MAELELSSFSAFDASSELFPELSESKPTGVGAARHAGACPSSVQLETTGLISHRRTIKPRRHGSAKKPQSEFWHAQTAHKESIIAKLRSLRRMDLTEKLENCHQEAHYAKCTSCAKVKVLLNRCDRFYCPECQPSLSRDRRKQVEWWAKEIEQPKHVVLTLKNFDGIDRECVLWAKACFAKFRRRRFCRNWRGGFYSLEVTNEGRGWHLHFHILVDARYIDERLLSAEWNAATDGRGRIVKVSDCRRKDYLAEVTKYAVKGNQLAAWPAQHIADFIDAFTGIRTFGVFGILFGLRTQFREWFNQQCKQSLTCECGCCDFHIHTELEWKLIQEGIPLHTIRGP